MAPEALGGPVDPVDQAAPVAMADQEDQTDTDNGTTTDQEDHQEGQEDHQEGQVAPVAQDTQAAQVGPDSLEAEVREIHTDRPMVEEHGTTIFGRSKARRTCFPVCLLTGTTVSNRLGHSTPGSKPSSTGQ